MQIGRNTAQHLQAVHSGRNPMHRKHRMSLQRPSHCNQASSSKRRSGGGATTRIIRTPSLALGFAPINAPARNALTAVHRATTNQTTSHRTCIHRTHVLSAKQSSVHSGTASGAEHTTAPHALRRTACKKKERPFMLCHSIVDSHGFTCLVLLACPGALTSCSFTTRARPSAQPLH